MRVYLDTEVYQNYFLALITNDAGVSKWFQIFNKESSGHKPEDFLAFLKHRDVETVTFNGIHYDIPILTYALVSRNTRAIKMLSDRIINGNMRSWEVYRELGLREPSINHIDLKEVAPGMVSLKLYGGRMGSKKLQELPIHHDAQIQQEDVAVMRKYCRNDTLVTCDLYHTLSKQIELRRTMSDTYGVDLRSKSDAQIAEAVLKAEYRRITKSDPPKVSVDGGAFYYEPPEYVRFRTEPLREAFEIVCSAKMEINEDTGHVIMPDEIAKMKIQIGSSTYKIGIGGLHSQESEVAHFSDDENVLIDRDVESYYPRMMLNMNMQPGGFGEHFNTIYERVLEERLAAKHAGDKVTSDSLKIVLNGTFGKTSSKFSPLYSPDFMVRTTVTGQLTVLMLIEALELCSIPVVSANTDGIVIKCPVGKVGMLNKVVEQWEQHTGLKTEETKYRALYSRDVNNYFAIKADGSVKRKGVYAPSGLSKNPQNPICSEAVAAYLSEGTPISVTIRECDDIRKFITLRTVNGGALCDGQPIGKAVRWYYARDITEPLTYATNGNKVPRSEGAMPLMDLPDEIPEDLNYEWYERECEEILMDVGAVPRPVVEKIPRKNSKAWKKLVEEGRIVENHKGKWEWA